MSEIQNPQNQPGMDKSVILVFAVSMILLVLAQQFLSKPQPKNEQKNDTKTEQRVAQPQGASAAVTAPAPISAGLVYFQYLSLSWALAFSAASSARFAASRSREDEQRPGRVQNGFPLGIVKRG